MRADSWCVIEVDGRQHKANIRHIGKGKFRIIEADGDSQVGNVVDASDVIFCLDPSFSRVKAIEITKRARAIMERYLSGSIDKAKAKTELNGLIDETSS